MCQYAATHHTVPVPDLLNPAGEMPCQHQHRAVHKAAAYRSSRGVGPNSRRLLRLHEQLLGQQAVAVCRQPLHPHQQGRPCPAQHSGLHPWPVGPACAGGGQWHPQPLDKPPGATVERLHPQGKLPNTHVHLCKNLRHQQHLAAIVSASPGAPSALSE